MDKRNNKDFKDLQDKWYKKAGFEVESSEYSVIKTPGRYLYDTYRGHQIIAAKQRYYELAGQFLHSYQFIDTLEKKIWNAHSEGVTIRQIAETLKLSKSAVHRTIKYLKEEMIKQNVKEYDSE